jgi:hypothetical protein
MGYGKTGKWVVEKDNLDMEVKDTQQCSVLSFINPTFHYSTIPLFHVQGISFGLDKHL